jgi:RNA polymerase sigma-70 factor (ECF subfamily)
VDDATVARFRGGDGDAFLAVHDAYAPAIRALVGRFFASPFEREEAAQEIWLQAHRMASAYEPARGPLLPWLRALAGNRCKELLRARGRRPDPREELDESEAVAGGGDGSDGAAADPEAAARLGRLRAAVARFSSELTEEEATVLRLSLLEERTHDEVAALTGRSARRCKYLRAKLLERAAAHPELRAALEEVLER